MVTQVSGFLFVLYPTAKLCNPRQMLCFPVDISSGANSYSLCENANPYSPVLLESTLLTHCISNVFTSIFITDLVSESSSQNEEVSS